MRRKTKIICTIGPASDDPKVLRALMEAGMNVARLNFSHGSHEEQRKRTDLIKQVRKELGLPVAIMLDTKGPEIRTGKFEGDRIHLDDGAEVRIVQEEVLGTPEAFSVTYKRIAKDVKEGSIILINDGLIELKVVAIEGADLRCEVVHGGEISNHKSINLPDVELVLPAVTEKDILDLNFAVENEFDWIAASFVRKPEDVLEIRKHLASAGDKDIKIVAKIENREGVENYERILDVADGIMVARGDLGVGIPAEEVPLTQKHLIQTAYRYGLPSITATEMLDSMIRNPRPTRAEVSDVANAIIDGTSCIMLSGETAMGAHPVESVKMMDRIARYTERNIPYWENFRTQDNSHGHGVTNAISHAACITAMDLDAKALITVTHSGRTAKMLSHFRPACSILAATVTERSCHQLALSWGVHPVLVPVITNTDELFDTAMEAAVEAGLASDGDIVVITGGTPAGMSGTTNTLRVETVGSLLCQGTPIQGAEHTIIFGDAMVVKDGEAPEESRESRNYILVAQDTSTKDLPMIRESRAIIVETDKANCHAVMAAEVLQIPVIYGCTNATKLIKNGQMISLDLETGRVS